MSRVDLSLDEIIQINENTIKFLEKLRPSLSNTTAIDLDWIVKDLRLLESSIIKETDSLVEEIEELESQIQEFKEKI